MDELTYKRMKLIKDIVRNPLFDEAMKVVRADILDEIGRSDYSETVSREFLYLEVQALARIVGRFKTIANDVVHTEARAQAVGAV